MSIRILSEILGHYTIQYLSCEVQHHYKRVLALFSVYVLLCSVYMGATWNNCIEGYSNKCINSTTNGVTKGQRLPVFSFVPL